MASTPTRRARDTAPKFEWDDSVEDLTSPGTAVSRPPSTATV